MVRERLDYKEHLVGYTRQELDNLKKLVGRFQEVEAEMVVKRLDAEGEELEDVTKDTRDTGILKELEAKKDYVIKEDNKEKRGWHFKGVESTVDDVWIELCTKSFIDIYFGKIVRKNYDIYIKDRQLVTTQKISSWEGLSYRANRIFLTFLGEFMV